MRTTCIGMALVVVAALVSAPAWGQVLWEDDFDGYAPGDLTGQLGPNGQTWETFNLGGWVVPTSMQTDPALTHDGTNGAGHTTTISASGISLGVPIESGFGYFFVEYDLQIGGNLPNGPQWWLRDQSAAKNITIAMDNSAIPFSQSRIGDSEQDVPHAFEPALEAGVDTNLHFKWRIDVDAKTFDWEAYSIQNPDKQVSVTSTYTDDWFPDSIYLYHNDAGDGYDNLILYVPEPASLALLGLGGLALLSRKRRA